MKATGHSSLLDFLTFMVLLKSAAFTEEKSRQERSLSLLGVILSAQFAEQQYQYPKTQAQSNDPTLQYMLHLYSRSADEEGRPRENRTLGSNTVRLLKSSASSTRHGRTGTDPWHMHSVKYELKILQGDTLVKVAIVHLRMEPHITKKIACKLKVFTASPMEDNPSSLQDPWILFFRPEDKWVETDITTQVFALAGHLDENLTLYIWYACVEDGRNWRFSRAVKKPQKVAVLQAPALLLYINDSRNAGRQIVHRHSEGPLKEEKRHLLYRKIRQLGNIGSDIPNYLRRNSVVRNECKLHSFRVSFHQLGWDHWIIAPHKYNPKYCLGDCPRILHYGYNSPNHAIVQNFINELVDGEVPRPSCVPYKYKPISVLMKEQNGSIVYKEYEDMIAESCTCR
ncbi:bone morphogenetic protein 15 [Erpetoichthys calabaricus]|uniref:TGF-beta family profile domain-containing protein n=1 Tax=Erpetoichthys calabaricus TaxID=27687 RepID=A0A8C4SC41_ERPCA|nr:bone morphogenetic protein 15 [Erpetoichthys calabaricus]